MADDTSKLEALQELGYSREQAVRMAAAADAPEPAPIPQTKEQELASAKHWLNTSVLGIQADEVSTPVLPTLSRSGAHRLLNSPIATAGR